MSFVEKLLELHRDVATLNERLRVSEGTNKDTDSEIKKTWSLGKVITLITLALTLVGGGGFFGWYYIWRDVNPQYDYINWKYTMPHTYVDMSGKVIETTRSYTGQIPIKEGDNEFVLPHRVFKGNCFVYKQDKTLSLQTTMMDNRNDLGIGPRVTNGCSPIKYDQFPFRNNQGDPLTYEFECCWSSEKIMSDSAVKK